VEICTDIPVPRIAASAAAVSEIAATKLPPSDTQVRISPRCMARIAFTASTPCARGIGTPNSSSMAARKDSGICSQMPMVRSPCTLLCPRIGEAPAPGLPMLPRRRSRLMISLIPFTAALCCVSPMAQVTIVAFESM
jgi:hypothetical protein